MQHFPPQFRRADFPDYDTFGAFILEIGRNVKEFRDGLSHTAMGSEILARRDERGNSGNGNKYDPRGIWFQGLSGGAIYEHRKRPNTSDPDIFSYNSSCATDPVPCPVDMPRACGAADESEVYFSARSRHPGGVNVLFGDGHAALVSDSVNFVVWQAIATVDKGEVVGEL